MPPEGGCLSSQDLYDQAPEGSDLKEDLADEDDVVLPTKVEEEVVDVDLSKYQISVEEYDAKFEVNLEQEEEEGFDLANFFSDNESVFSKGEYKVGG